LTLLANRSLFWNRVEHALALAQRTTQRVAVMFLDLDNFKNVNDSLGPTAAIACCRQRHSDWSSRPAFRHGRTTRRRRSRILLEGIGSDLDVERVAARSAPLQPAAAARRPGNEATASIGVACHGPVTTPSNCCARRHPCTARRPAGKARLVVFQPHMQEQFGTTAAAGAGHRPRTGPGRVLPGVPAGRRPDEPGVAGLEALLRWNHPRAAS